MADRPHIPYRNETRLALSRLPFSYPDVGATAAQWPAGYLHDRHVVDLGAGRGVFAGAVAALREWRQFPPAWTQVHSAGTPIEAGETVQIAFQFLGRSWFNPCRIVYVIDEPRRFGFAYGTLPGHVERGEELFLIEWGDDDQVRYHIKAFSRPACWLVWLGYPFARWQQRRFRLDSGAAMREAVGSLEV